MSGKRHNEYPYVASSRTTRVATEFTVRTNIKKTYLSSMRSEASVASESSIGIFIV
jgi:hypothetical protein